jgi:hypothetical protein
VSFSANLTLKGELFAMKKKRFSVEKIVAVETGGTQDASDRIQHPRTQINTKC